MACKNCGTELPESSKFCTKCGTPTSAEELNISAAGVERAVPKGFSAKKNIIIIIIAAILLIGGGITAIAVVNSHSASSGISDRLQLAERYLNEQNYEQAIIEYQKVLEIEPMNVDAYLGLADAYLGMGDTDKALEWLNKGFELTGDSRIQTKLYELKKPLTANELSWILEPIYKFDSVRPIFQTEFQGIHSNGSIETSYPSYSYTEEYYAIQQGDYYRLFYMPTSLMSPFASSIPLRVVHGIYFYLENNASQDPPAEALELPWRDVVEIGARGGGLFGTLIWDSFTKKGYMVSSDLGEWFFEPATDLLNKNYPVQKYDLSSWEEVPQKPIKLNGGDNQNDQTMPLEKPTDTKYALWSPENKLLTDFIYDDMSVSSYGITAACRGGKWGYLNENGQPITEFIYDALWYTGRHFNFKSQNYEDEYAAYPCTSDTMVVSLDGKMGVLYRNGRTLIDFGEFDDLAPAWNDQLWAKQDGKWGLIDLKAAKKSFGINAKDDSTPSHSSSESSSGVTSTEVSEPTEPVYGSMGSVTILGEEYDVATTISLDLSHNGIGITGEQWKEILPKIAKLVNLTKLDLGSNEISDITPLAKLTNLTELHLWSNQITDITPLAKLTNLTELDLSYNQISDITPLAKLVNLTKLGLYENQISDITPLAKLTNLTELWLNENKISDIASLAKLTDLTYLNLRWNQISDITPLAKLTNLTTLDLLDNQIKDIKPLAKLTNLTELWLNENQISDINPLANLTNLTYLNLWNNQISDITPLSNLTNLTELQVGFNQISDEDIKNLIKRLPRCDISY